MKSILNLRYLVALAVVMTLFASCGKDDEDDGGGTGSGEIVGCTDSAASNYNADATVSDNSCVYSRDQFIGNYQGSMTFENLGGLLNQDSLAFTITPGIANANQVLVGVTIQSIPVFLSGMAVGDSILVNDTYNLPDGGAINPLLTGMPVDVVFAGGVGTMNGGQSVEGKLDIVFQTANLDDIEDVATLKGTRQ